MESRDTFKALGWLGVAPSVRCSPWSGEHEYRSMYILEEVEISASRILLLQCYKHCSLFACPRRILCTSRITSEYYYLTKSKKTFKSQPEELPPIRNEKVINKNGSLYKKRKKNIYRERGRKTLSFYSTYVMLYTN